MWYVLLVNEQTYFEKTNEKERVEKEIGSGLLETGSGLNQELSFIRPGDTRWNSHYKTLVRLVDMFPSIIRVLEYVKDECFNPCSQNQAIKMLAFLSSFEFVFYLHLMLHILGLTDVLSRALQRKDQDILEAVLLVETTRGKLQDLRESGFDQLLEKIHLFCAKHDIQTVDMAGNYINDTGYRPKRKRYNLTNQHYYNFECFNTVVDMEIQDGDRFNEINTN
ncbi:putative ribonuclease H-like superfamily [Helianthus annuus]|nr:putative ribonuclease H-like superfamily [Helianthus annuus]